MKAAVCDDRFVLSIPEPSHLDGLDGLLNDPEVAAWLGGPRSRDAIAVAIEEERRHWEQHGFGPWVALDAVDRAVVGRGGLRRSRVGERDEVELFYAVAPSLWGLGIATSLSRAAVDLGFRDAGVDSIVAFTLKENRASRRVAEKLGFRYEAIVQHAGTPHIMLRSRAPSVA